MKRSLFLICITLILVTGCAKVADPDPDDGLDEYGLPKYSETGSRTIACLVDGEPWVAPKKGGIFVSPSATINVNSGFLSSGGGRDNGIYLYLKGYLNPSNPERKYIAFDESGSFTISIDDLSKCDDEYYNPVDSVNNWLDVKYYNIETGVISGLFEAKVANILDTICGDTFHLTQGRFDMPVEYIE